jgi:putative flippase GtrA
MTRLARFGVTGAAATSLNVLILWLLVTKFGVWYLGASIVAFSLSLACNFTLQKVWAFSASCSGQPATQLVQFLSFNLVAMLLNTAILYIAVECFRLSAVVGQLVNSAILALMSYRAYRWIFSSTQHSSNPAAAPKVPNAVVRPSTL